MKTTVARSTAHLWRVALLAVILTPLGALAAGDDPPSRAARLAYVQGSVSFQPAGTEDWVEASINRPLTIGDKLWSDSDGRVELQLDGSTVRLSSNTAASFLNVGDAITQVQLTAGTLLVHVRRLDDDETYEIDTPNLAFSILRPGTYRLSVDESGTTTAVRVRSGQGEATGGDSAYPVRANEDDFFSGTERLAESVQPARAELDPFETWAAERDARWERSVSAQYVSQDIVGYQDLDDQGSWRRSSDFGYVWFPRAVEPGWAPYHNGHWAYIAPWGYTWVDEAPWGFAPFHYGRWIFQGGAWGWVPAAPRVQGVVYVRPIYAPALVAWVGVGASVAWFPLGPREVYVPSYPVSRRYVNNINVSNTTVKTTVINNVYNTTVVNNRNVTVNYVNRAAPGAVTAMTSQAFASAQPVSRSQAHIDPHAMSTAPVRAAAPAVMPTKQAALGSQRTASVKPLANIQARTVVARTTPPPSRVTAVKIVSGVQPGAGQPIAARAPLAAATSSAAPARADRPPSALGKAGQAGSIPVIHPTDLPSQPKRTSPADANTAQERQQLQQEQTLRVQQDTERAKTQQRQALEHQQLGKDKADDARHQELERQHQQQSQQLQQKHKREEQQLREKQQPAGAQPKKKVHEDRSAKPTT